MYVSGMYVLTPCSVTMTTANQSCLLMFFMATINFLSGCHGNMSHITYLRPLPCCCQGNSGLVLSVVMVTDGQL